MTCVKVTFEYGDGHTVLAFEGKAAEKVQNLIRSAAELIGAAGTLSVHGAVIKEKVTVPLAWAGGGERPE